MQLPAWLKRIGHRWFPARVWSGGGVIIRKSQFEEYTGAALVNVGTSVAVGSGTIPARWVLVVHGDDNEEHYLNVAKEVWDGHDVGDVIDAADPIVEIS